MVLYSGVFVSDTGIGNCAKFSNSNSGSMRLFVEKCLMMFGALCLLDFIIGSAAFTAASYSLEARKLIFYLLFGAVFAGYQLYRTYPGLNGNAAENKGAESGH